jgi:cytochrome c oxidase subunit 2
VEAYQAPPGAVTITGVGKQWMWKFQHPGGQREIDALHVPVGRAVKLLLTSEDVIHSFYVPAFRTKQDVLPGRYTTVWFEATHPGSYHLFCSEYCGTSHSQMRGRVTAMTPEAYERWLTLEASESIASRGSKLFLQLGCNTCHREDSLRRAPVLSGLYGRRVQLADGRLVTADEDYIRESILEPAAKVVLGWQPIMPTFKGRVSEEEIMQLVAYIESLEPSAPGAFAPEGQPLFPADRPRGR